MDTALVIMAAGLGSRFGQGIKQLEALGPSGESIMEYSIHDALKAGFNRVIFILRRDILEDFRSAIGKRVEAACSALHVKVDYVFQELTALPDGVTLPEGRTKPWGTGQAVLACKDILDCPFVVVNADDYYGREAFALVHDFLVQSKQAGPEALCMAAFVLKNTLSDHGDVNRGVCQVQNGYLTGVKETCHIAKHTSADGIVTAWAEGIEIGINTLVSMNVWGLTPGMLDMLEDGFKAFFDELAAAPDRAERELKAEYFLPDYIDHLLKAGKATVKVLESHDRWFGITYQGDKETVKQELKALTEQGVYNRPLFDDLCS